MPAASREDGRHCGVGVAVDNRDGFASVIGRVDAVGCGVDIFFVISGYLISTILFENLDKDVFRFSFHAQCVD